MHVLVDPFLPGREPVVDGAELGQDPSLDAGLLGDLPGRGLLEGLAVLHVALRQAPLHAAGAVAARDHGDPGDALVHVDDDAAGRALLHRGEPAVGPLGVARWGGHAATLTSRGRQAAARRGGAAGPPSGSGRRRSGRACVVPAPARGHLPLSLVSSPQPPAALLQQAVAHLAPVVPLLTELGELFNAEGHELALVGGPVRDAFLGRSRRTWTSPPVRPLSRPSASSPDGATPTGTSGATSGRSAPAVEPPPSRSPPTGLTPTTGRPASRSSPSGTTSRTTWFAATSPSTRWRCGCPRWSSWTRMPGWRTWRSGCCAPPGRPR